MNDRYLCKGKDKDDGRWYQGYYLLLHDTTYCCMPSGNAEEAKRLEDANTHHYIVFERMTDWGLPNKHLRAEILPETLCQCSGKPDKNNNLIFENDLVNANGTVYVCRFDEDNFAWEFQNREETIGICCFFPIDIEIIGNTYDNPELLEVGE